MTGSSWLPPSFLSTPSARRATRRDGQTAADLNHFYPRPPRGGRPLAAAASLWHSNFYPRPPRGGRLQQLGIHPESWKISIHALREEGDHTAKKEDASHADFYPRPPRGGRHSGGVKDQMTAHNFYPRPPRGGRQAVDGLSRIPGRISIHALREEGDPLKSDQTENILKFLSTPSARRATFNCAGLVVDQRISIHALREEGDG